MPGFSVSRHPSGRPRTICQTRHGGRGEPVPHGIWTEWFDTGELRRFVDYVDGAPHGIAVRWDRDGAVRERRTIELGTTESSAILDACRTAERDPR